MINNKVIKIILYSFIGIISGTLSSMGLGGGGILIPFLTLIGVKQKEAQLTNLICYIPIALISSFTNLKNQLVDLKIVRKIILFSIIGAIVGSEISKQLEGEILKIVFGILMLTLGVYQVIEVSKERR